MKKNLMSNAQIEKQFLSSSVNSHQFSKNSFIELSHSSFTKVFIYYLIKFLNTIIRAL